MKSELLNVLRRYLRPEFINRIDEIIVFHAPDRKQIRDIIGPQPEPGKPHAAGARGAGGGEGGGGWGVG